MTFTSTAPMSNLGNVWMVEECGCFYGTKSTDGSEFAGSPADQHSFLTQTTLGRGRLFIARLFLAWRCMRSLVSPEFGPEMLVLLPELFELLNLFPELLVLFFKRSKAIEYLLFGWLRQRHNQTRRDGLRSGDHPSKMNSFACCIDLLHYSYGS